MARYDTDGSSALAPNDPYNNMEGADIRPSFQVYNGGNTSAPSKGNRDNFKVLDGGKSNNARDVLRNSENSALAKNEATPWKNNVSGSRNRNNDKNSKGKGKLSGKKKGIAASGIIVGIITAIIAFIGGSHSLLLPAMGVLSDLSTNTQNTAIMKRLPKAVNAALSKVNRKGWPSTTESTLSKRLNGNTNINIDEFDTNATVRSAITDTIDGRAGGYYSNTADASFNYHGNSRNVFNDYEQSGDADTDMRNFRGTVNDQLSGRTSAQLTTTREEEVEDLDEDGKGTGSYSAEEQLNEITQEETKNTYATEAEASEAVKTQLGKLASRVSKAVTWGCTALQIGILAATTYQVTARTLQETGALNFLESPSKTMAGYGTQAAANAFLNAITQATPTSVSDLRAATITGDSSEAMNADDSVMPQNIISIDTGGATEEHNLSAVEADGLRAILTQSAPDVSKAYNYSSASAGDIITRGLKALGISMLACAGIQGGIAAFSLAVKIIPGVGQVTALGSSTWHAAKSLATQILKALGKGVILNVAVSSIVLFLIPLFTKMYLSDAVNNFTGYAGGQNLASGISSASATLARNASGLPIASRETALVYNRLTQEVIAQEAEVDRMYRSPFDITSNNTFLGSILYGLLPATLSSAPNQGITSASSLIATTSKSIAQLTGQVSAAGEGTSFNTAFGSCDSLEDIGGACNAFGIEITATDPSILDIDVNDPQYISTIDASLDCNGNDCEVKENSGLAKYIRYYAMRASPFGVYDMNIYNELQNNNVVLSLIPYVGDGLDILNAGKVIANEDIITGAAYVASNDNPAWEENKYYSLYLIDNHILDQWGVYDDITNPVLAYMDKVNAEREAEDNSYIAKLARSIGATKEDTEMMLDVIAYYQFLETYDADMRIALNESTSTIPTSEQIIATTKTNQLIDYTNNNLPTTIFIAHIDQIIYADTRNRNYTV